jgi:hypothetical protein
MRFISALAVTAFIMLSSCKTAGDADPWIITTPAGERYAVVNPTGETIIPNGRIPLLLEKHCCGSSSVWTYTVMTGMLLLRNSGTGPLSITIIRNILSENSDVQQIPPTCNG